MGAIELNEGFARAGPQKGEPSRNPTGKNNPGKYQRNREIKAALHAALSEPCDIDGYRHLTKFECGIDSVVDLFMCGDRWAVTFVINRLFGRVPLNIEMDVTTRTDELDHLSDAELLARLDALREQLAPPTLDGDVVQTDDLG